MVLSQWLRARPRDFCASRGRWPGNDDRELRCPATPTDDGEVILLGLIPLALAAAAVLLVVRRPTSTPLHTIQQPGGRGALPPGSGSWNAQVMATA
jgi:hypothetical protein